MSCLEEENEIMEQIRFHMVLVLTSQFNADVSVTYIKKKKKKNRPSTRRLANSV